VIEGQVLLVMLTLWCMWSQKHMIFSVKIPA
jgi:hypothetical protein